MKCRTLRIWNAPLEDTTIKNYDNRWYVEHWGQGIYFLKTQTGDTMIIDDMSNIMDTVFIPEDTNMKNDDHMQYVKQLWHVM